MGSIGVLAISDAAVGTLLVLVLYVAPSMVAFARSHHNKWAIVAFNLLLGWTVLGWIGVLIWSLRRPRQQTQATLSYHDPGNPST
jgi:cytoskeletal protein RodZ